MKCQCHEATAKSCDIILMAAPTRLMLSSLANEAHEGRWLDQVLDATKDDAQKEMLTKDILQRFTADAEA